jgi:uncharacterized protein YfdQ (DUF2303 family)
MDKEFKEITPLAHALLEAFQRPVQIMANLSDDGIQRAALPPGWTLHEKDDIKLQDQPRRKKGRIDLTDINSFIDYINRHKIEHSTSIYCSADYEKGEVNYIAIIDDHEGPFHAPHWRDHTAHHDPSKSAEWTRWTKVNKQPMSQLDFAAFIEENLRDIASVDGMPTGQQLLEMALSFEANQDMRFKSAIRLQNGGVQLSLVQDDDSQTLSRMQLFEKISIGIPVFWNGEAYRIDARLRYRARDGKLVFWYELIRPDKVIEDATKSMIDFIKEKTEVFFYFGQPHI